MIAAITRPERLFKYYGHESKPLENRGLAVLKNLALKVTPPAEFNDPFEFSPNVKTQTRERFLPGCLESDEAFQQALPAHLSQHYGVICFTSEPADLLMWVHYASSHEGLLLEFDARASLFTSNSFFEVQYETQRAELDPWNDAAIRASFDALARRKSEHWRYEREYRVVGELAALQKRETPRGTIHFLPIPAAWILSVTFGLRSVEEIKAEVSRVATQSHFAHLRQFQMRMHPTDYALLRDEIDSSTQEELK
jgi:hypothetical protein